jgi:hypothetical protein
MSGTDERQSPPTDWPAAWAALALLDGDAWDDEIDRLDELWKTEYKRLSWIERNCLASSTSRPLRDRLQLMVGLRLAAG